MKIAIAGYGLEGESNYRYFAANSDNEIVIVDQRQPDRPIPKGVKSIIAKDALENLQGYDLVVRTAGLAPRKIKTDGKVWSATNEFFDKCPAPIIGVTGSKGKGTTASLIASILKAAGRKVWLVGNIGLPSLDILSQVSSDDLVVYELSSFQLWDLERSPQTAVVLFIEQEHLDVHFDMQDYVNAKSNIARYQTPGDYLVYNGTNQYSASIADTSNGTKISYPSTSSAHVDDKAFYYGEQKICSIGALQLMGAHNLDNACAAIDAVWPIIQDKKAIKNGLKSFKGLPHRLKFVRTVDGVDYYDDSIATTPSSAIAALNAFSKPKVIILGGSSKGSSFIELGRQLASEENTRAILIGEEAENIAHACQAAGFVDYEILEKPTAVNFVARARSLAVKGGVVLLSPACASFGLFKNYSDRGDQYIAAVEAL